MSAGGPAYKKMAPMTASTEWPGSGMWRRVGRTMFRTKSVEEALADRDDQATSLKKCLSLYELILFGCAPFSLPPFGLPLSSFYFLRFSFKKKI
jgi:hypothetical protein